MQVRQALWLETFLPNNSTASAMFSIAEQRDLSPSLLVLNYMFDLGR